MMNTTYLGKNGSSSETPHNTTEVTNATSICDRRGIQAIIELEYGVFLMFKGYVLGNIL